MERTGFAHPSAFATSNGRAHAGRRRASRSHGAEAVVPRSVGVTLAGMLALVLSLVPLVGWGAAWPPLAGFAPGWPIVSPLSALALAVAAIGVASQGPGASRRGRRTVAGICGVALLAFVALAFLLGPVAPPDTDPAVLVQGWLADPTLLLHRWPSPFTLGAVAFLGAALALLGLESSAAVRGAWIMAAAAALVALVTAGPASPELELAARLPLGRQPVAAATPPPLAFIVLLLATALLLLPTRDGDWWVPGSRVAGSVTRLLLPGLLLLLPGLVWVEELLERSQRLTPDAGRSLLATALVVALLLVLANAVRRLGRSESAERERDQRRLQRQLEAESEHVALRADQTLRVATDRYRAHLRSILDLAPSPFVAVDRDGYVAYLNGAAAELFGCRSGDAVGRTLWDVWPELGGELRAALAGTVGGAGIRQTLVSGRTGRTVELRGYPDDAGTALFLREVRG